MPIITVEGFREEAPLDWLNPEAAQTAKAAPAVAIEAEAEPEGIAGLLTRITIIAAPFASPADGRGFSLARRLRALGYKGRLRARGELTPDQFRHALDSGFDEVEISDDRAKRQPEAQWLAALERRANTGDYRRKLAGG